MILNGPLRRNSLELMELLSINKVSLVRLPPVITLDK